MIVLAALSVAVITAAAALALASMRRQNTSSARHGHLPRAAGANAKAHHVAAAAAGSLGEEAWTVGLGRDSVDGHFQVQQSKD